MLSAVMAFAAVSVCAPFSDASQSDSVSVIVPSDGLSVDDPLGLILGFEQVSAEVGRAEGTVLILMTGAPYEDDEIFVAVTEAIGPDLFVTCKDLGSLGEFDFLEDPANPPPEQPLSKGVDLEFLEQILAFVESSMRWMMLADDLESEKKFLSKSPRQDALAKMLPGFALYDPRFDKNNRAFAAEKLPKASYSAWTFPKQRPTLSGPAWKGWRFRCGITWIRPEAWGWKREP